MVWEKNVTMQEFDPTPSFLCGRKFFFLSGSEKKRSWSQHLCVFNNGRMKRRFFENRQNIIFSQFREKNFLLFSLRSKIAIHRLPIQSWWLPNIYFPLFLQHIQFPHQGYLDTSWMYLFREPDPFRGRIFFLLCRGSFFSARKRNDIDAELSRQRFVVAAAKILASKKYYIFLIRTSKILVQTPLSQFSDEVKWVRQFGNKRHL